MLRLKRPQKTLLSEILSGSCVFSLFQSKRPFQNFTRNLSDLSN